MAVVTDGQSGNAAPAEKLTSLSPEAAVESYHRDDSGISNYEKKSKSLM
jgi:hypothetical protein